MPDLAQLDHLLSQVSFNERLNAIEGINPFRRLLANDADGHILRFLAAKVAGLRGKTRAGIAFVLAERYLATNDMGNLRVLFEVDDSATKEFVLNALWGQPGSVEMGHCIAELALEATRHAAPAVRREACSVIQNQCSHGVDVTPALGPLQSLLLDPDSHVRQQAAYAVGNLAKRKYGVSAHLPALRRNLNDEILFVREASAWAIWHLSRYKHDIRDSVNELAALLATDEQGDGVCKNAAGALLHHAKKSAENARQVKSAIETCKLDPNRRVIQRLLDQLTALP